MPLPPPPVPLPPPPVPLPPPSRLCRPAPRPNTVVENDLYRITFSNRGAQVTSWVLKQFKDVDGHPLDLVHPQAAKLFGYPLSLYTDDGTKASIAAVSRNGNVVTLMTSGKSARWDQRTRGRHQRSLRQQLQRDLRCEGNGTEYVDL